MKNPLTLAGIEPATLQFLAQHLNHCATAVPGLLRLVLLKALPNHHSLLLFIHFLVRTDRFLRIRFAENWIEITRFKTSTTHRTAARTEALGAIFNLKCPVRLDSTTVHMWCTVKVEGKFSGNHYLTPRVKCPNVTQTLFSMFSIIWCVYRVLVGKLKGKWPLGRPRRKRQDNIKMDLQKVGCGGMDWIDVVQDRDRRLALVNAVMNLRVP